MNIPSTLAVNIARFSDAPSPTKCKQRAENAPFSGIRVGYVSDSPAKSDKEFMLDF